MGSEHLSNEEIRSKLINYGVDCGPITSTTRAIYVKKLESLNSKKAKTKNKLSSNDTISSNLTDGELRDQLLAFGQTVAPITNTNRHIYVERLQKLKGEKNSNNNKIRKRVEMNDYDGAEPMEVD